jgi:leukotriene-A4 hydrolase
MEALLNHTEDGASYPFSISFLEALDKAYDLNARKNSEIMLRWHSLCLRSEADWIVPHVVDFITSQGRMKFVRPLYRALRTSKVGGKLADEVFAANKNM